MDKATNMQKHNEKKVKENMLTDHFSPSLSSKKQLTKNKHFTH